MVQQTQSGGMSPKQGDVKTRRARRVVVIAGVVGLLAVGGWAAMAMTGSPNASVGQPPAGAGKALDLFEVAKTDFDISITATGDLRARNQVELRSNMEQETTITEIVPEGITVTKGEVLVRLNAENTQTRLDEESLDLESARAAVVEANEAYAIQVSENESATRAARLKLALAELSLDQWRLGEVKSKEQELNHNVESSEKDVTRLEEKVQKSNDLFKAGYYSRDQLQQDELELERAVATRDKAVLAKRIYWEYEHPKEQKQKTSDVEEAEAEVERVERLNASRLVSKEADRKNKQQALSIREQKFNKLKDQLDAAVIKAPSDGLVVYATSIDSGRWGDESGPLQVGSKVYPQQGLIVLPDTSEMLAHVKVHESIAGRVRKGMPCTIKIDAAGDARFTGKVDSVGVLAEQTSRWMDPTLREYTVKIAIDRVERPGGGGGVALRPSMRCEAEITLGRVSEALSVPIQAVHSEGLLRYVHIAAGGGRYTRRPVLVGQRSDRFAEVKVGLSPGEYVLLRKPDPALITNPGTSGWNTTELAAVGLEINETGDIVPNAEAMAARGMMGEGGRGNGRPGGRRGPRGGGGPAGETPANSTPDPAKPAGDGTETSSSPEAKPASEGAPAETK